MFSRGETLAASIVSFLAAAIVSAYLLDAIGMTLHPAAVLLMSLAAGSATLILSDPPRARPSAFATAAVDPQSAQREGWSTGSGRAGSSDLVAFAAIVGVMLAWLLWLAWPHLLPIGGGSDLTHHLLLIDYIERSGRLTQDRALLPYLGEMIDYTPGAHVLAVLASRWTRSDGLHALYPVIALSVALKTGLIFLIARRCLSRDDAKGGMALALAAVLLLFVPDAYLLGSFTHDSFLAQVVAELFAVAMWWALVCWDGQPRAAQAALAGLAGAATFLTWPVWTGPPLVTLALLVVLPAEEPRGVRTRHAAIVVLPIATVAVVHALRHFGAATIAGATGFAPAATPAVIGWLFLSVGTLGTLLAIRERRARTIPILLCAIALQAAALVVVARASGAETPYLARKMVYLAIYPLAVAGALAIERLTTGRLTTAYAALAVMAIVVVRGLAAMPRPMPAISDSLLDAGRWARTHVQPACVDYLVADDDSAYWLHLVVLGNPRAAPRSLAKDTFEPDKALVRWILPGGLPFAIAEHYDALPRDIRDSVDVLARFGRAAVVKRRGDASCR